MYDEKNNDMKFAFTKINFILMGVAFALIVIGFVLMSGGGAATPEEFHYEIFSWRRITLAPIAIVAGFAFEIYAILKRF